MIHFGDLDVVYLPLVENFAIERIRLAANGKATM